MFQGRQGGLVSHNSTSWCIGTDFAAARIDDFGLAHDVAYPIYTPLLSGSGPKYVYDN